MIQTSEGYKAAIKADGEQDSLECTFRFIPPGSTEGAGIGGSPQASCSRLNQVLNDASGMGGKWVTLEPNRWRLDGSMELIDGSGLRQIGFFSKALCNAEGTFTDPPWVDYFFDAAYDLIGISLYFDDLCREWATGITVEYHAADGSILQRATFQNDLPVCLIDMQQVGVKWFRVLIEKWNIPGRMAKIARVLPGQIYLFTPENTYEFSFSETIKPFESAITLPEFTIVFDNADKKFDIVNPKGLVAFLRKKMVVSASLSILVGDAQERVSMGDFYVYAWPDDTQEDKASLTCRPSMAFKNRPYENAGRGVQTAEQAAAIIFSDVGEAYSIAPALRGIEVNQYIGDDVPKVDAMGQLAVACCAYWKIDRDGTYHLMPWEMKAASNAVDYDSAWSKPSISQRARYTSVCAKSYSWDAQREQMVSNDRIVALDPDDGERKTISCPFVTAARAEAVSAAALAYYGLRLNYAVNYRGDMSIEAGDTIEIENDYAMSRVLVLNHDISFDGDKKITASIKGVGL